MSVKKKNCSVEKTLGRIQGHCQLNSVRKLELDGEAIESAKVQVWGNLEALRFKCVGWEKHRVGTS